MKEQTKTKARDTMYESKTNYIGDIPEEEYQVTDTPTKFLNTDGHYIHRNIPVGDSIAIQEMGRNYTRQMDTVIGYVKDIDKQLKEQGGKINMALLVLGVDEQGKPTGNGIKGDIIRIKKDIDDVNDEVVFLKTSEAKNSTSVSLLFKLVWGTFGASVAVLFEAIMTHIMK